MNHNNERIFFRGVVESELFSDLTDVLRLIRVVLSDSDDSRQINDGEIWTERRKDFDVNLLINDAFVVSCFFVLDLFKQFSDLFLVLLVERLVGIIGKLDMSLGFTNVLHFEDGGASSGNAFALWHEVKT